jgi:hypothetical protein
MLVSGYSFSGFERHEEAEEPTLGRVFNFRGNREGGQGREKIENGFYKYVSTRSPFLLAAINFPRRLYTEEFDLRSPLRISA